MNELVKALDAIGEKEWFKQQMGMKRQVVFYLCVLIIVLGTHLSSIEAETRLLKPPPVLHQDGAKSAVGKVSIGFRRSRDPGMVRP